MRTGSVVVAVLAAVAALGASVGVSPWWWIGAAP